MRKFELIRGGTFALALLCALILNSEMVDAADGSDDSAQIQKFNTEELHTLVAPIALYSDALLAQLLPASAFPVQIVDAYRFIQNGGNADAVPEANAWDSSVVALLHYPTALRQLNDDLKWTEQLGLAVTYQMDDVSQAIQQARAEARAVGNLVSNDKQVVERENDVIQIVSANPEVIYVPQYDPTYIYERRLGDPYVWGTGYGYGLWLGNSWDWNHNRIWMNNYWRGGRWNQTSRPSYWRAPYRTVPNWYSRTGNHGYVANRVTPQAFSAHNAASNSGMRPGVTNPQPRPNVTSPTVRPTPRANSVPRTLLDSADLRNRGIQSRIESARGQNSRTTNRPAVNPPTSPQVAPRIQPAQPAPAPAPRPSFHEGSNSSRGAIQQQSNRGAASRSSGGGGGGGARRK